ncbi:MAG: B12-binding domain-containing radical SAM protein [Elusimicrobia bacterium]|nr:B12-binding domain-containing radical SAM protein [Candidatus Liberimonas magnetica]
MINRKEIKNVLLVIESPRQTDHSLNTMPPLGLLYLDAVLEKNGFNSRIIDANCGSYDIDIVKDYDLIGFSVFCSNVELSFEKISYIRKHYPQKNIVIGGPQSSLYSKEYLANPDINAIFIGESENNLIKYLTAVNDEDIKGVYFRQDSNSGFKFNGLSTDFEDLNALPLPSYHKVDLNKYKLFPLNQKPFAGILTSRGCTYKCSFCYHNMGFKWRPRSPKNIVDEIEYLSKTLKVKEICIVDDNFTFDKKRVLEICYLIQKRDIKLKFQLENGVRVDLCDEDVVRSLSEIGVWLLCFAPESGNAESLKKMQKGLELEKIKAVVECCRKYKIRTYAFYMIGFPWESRKDILNTIDYSNSLGTDFAHFSRFTVFPNTPIVQMLKGHFSFPDPYKDISLLSSNVNVENMHLLTVEDLNALIKVCFRKFYCKADKILLLLRTTPLAVLFKVVIYAFKTKNI